MRLARGGWKRACAVAANAAARDIRDRWVSCPPHPESLLALAWSTHIVEHKVQARVLWNDFPQANYVCVPQILEECHLTKRGHRNALIVRIEAHLFQRHNTLIHLSNPSAPHGSVASSEDDTIGALADFLQEIEALQEWGIEGHEWVVAESLGHV